MTPCAAFGGALDAAAILEFVDAGRDLLIAVDSRLSEEMRCVQQLRHCAALDGIARSSGLRKVRDGEAP